MNIKYAVCKAGKYPQGNIAEADLLEMQQSYKPAYHEAPLTLDHAQTGAALGYVKSLSFENGTLFAEFKDVQQELVDLTNSGKYKRPSVEVANYDGKKYLRAVSFVPFPAVKGLPPIKFKEDVPVVYFSEDLEINFTNNNKDKIMKEKFLKFCEKFNITSQDETTAFAELDSHIVALSEKVTSLEAENASLKAEKTEQVKKYNESLVGSLIASGKALPAQKEFLAKMAEFDADGFKKYADELPVLSIFEKDKAKQTQTPNPKDNKFRGEDGKPITYSEILKNPKLQENFKPEEIQAMREEYNK